MPARPLVAAACLAAALVLEGCGGGDDPRASAELPVVQLEVSAPVDMAVVEDEVVEVRGSVSPARATVRVLGKPAEVGRGRFTAIARLEPGDNVIDVIATARGREPAMTAIRVTREVPVTVPDLDGLEEAEARDALRAAGLAAEVDRRRGFLDGLLPGDPTVCAQDPEAGTEVRPGTTVQVLVAENC